MNIHFNPAILMWTTGVQGFDTLPFIDDSPFLEMVFFHGFVELPRGNMI